jgi:hypothetical protein
MDLQQLTDHEPPHFGREFSFIKPVSENHVSTIVLAINAPTAACGLVGRCDRPAQGRMKLS